MKPKATSPLPFRGIICLALASTSSYPTSTTAWEATNPNFSDFTQLTQTVQTSKDIFIFKHTLFLSLGYDITPLFRVDLAGMTTPDVSNFIIFPSLSYSLAENLDALLAVQYFISENPMENNQEEWLSGVIYGRLKYSF